MVGVAVFPPETIPGPVHEYVPPPEPDKVVLVVVQVSTLVGPALDGGAEFTVSTTDAQAVVLQDPTALT